MFYITDYITKMDTKTHEILSLMSKVIAQNPRQHETTDQGSAKTPLHKCLSQFSCQQQIHCQQVVHYLQGNDDTMISHTTVPTLSSLLLGQIHAIYNSKKTKTSLNTMKLTMIALKMNHQNLVLSN